MALTAPQAIELLHSHMQNINLRRHCMAVGFTMHALCEHLWDQGKISDKEKLGCARTELAEVWEVLGILHDADWEETKDSESEHTKHTLSWLKEKGITEGPVVHALMSHNTRRTHLAELTGTMEWALETCDELTGFIVAVALVRPDKKLETVEVKSVMKKWKTKEFAKAVDRTQIAQCEEKLAIPLNEFIEITLKAMQENHTELGL
ncbi:MAG: DUF2750 domain-containing protein [Candidatus Gottesmanbacteria bacterium]|nr:DUF2750 domain-containing protein [Candidatus Gottesmanbacteria bacterium]